ncbi:MAG TPA: hypothetical protein PLD20_15640 [Blastocatellia bacterium]|nr:hypothetical protein [Blastocatellia bacterium]HMX24257.1 hypothetical protein [Blastocatellia bacterium]HMZ19369.1 hypothetical protein [Blastocatellia bacterium]
MLREERALSAQVNSGASRVKNAESDKLHVLDETALLIFHL